MASTEGQAYNGGPGAEPSAEVQGAEPVRVMRGRGEAFLKLIAF